MLLIALPNLQNTLQRNQADVQIQNLFRNWQHARSLAISQQKPLRLCGSNDGNNCSRNWSNYLLVFHDKNNDSVATTTEILQIQSLDLANASVISGFALGKASLLINPRGYANLTGSFIYCPDSKKPRHIRRLSWSASGRPYFGRDTDSDGIIEASNGDAISC